jgi:UDP-glucose 4-epimerase
MKILVTGNAGFLGSHLVDAFLEDGHEVVGVDSLVSGYVDNINTTITQYIKDTSNYDEMNRIIKAEAPDIIYHAACAPYEGVSVVSPDWVTKNTFGNSVAIIAAAANNKVKRFVFCSSMSRYGGQTPPFSEAMPAAPEDPYAVAKTAAELVLKQMAETHGMEYAIAIPHNIIGSRQAYDDPGRNVASIMINRNLRGEPAIIYGDGEQTRCFSYVDDVIYSLKRMIDCPSGSIYNVGPDDKDGEVVSINELAVIVAEITGYKGEAIHMPGRPREVKHAFTSSDKIREEFGYQTKTNLRDGIRKIVEYVEERGTREFNYKNMNIEILNEKTPRTWVDRLI